MHVILKIVSIKEIICYKEIVILKINFIHLSTLGSCLDIEAWSTDIFSGFWDRYIWNSGFQVLYTNSEDTELIDFLFACFQCWFRIFGNSNSSNNLQSVATEIWVEKVWQVSIFKSAILPGILPLKAQRV